MTHKPFYCLLVAVILLLSHSENCFAQTILRQMPDYSIGSSSPAATNRNLTETPAAIRNTALMVVPDDFAKLKLAPGFLVNVNVLDDQDFVGSYRIDGNGDLALPILGTMHVAGKTALEARDQIVNRLIENKILKDPQVVLTVLEYTAPEVTIIGEVTSPGKYPLLVPHKLVDVLAASGGPTLLAGNEIQVIRSDAHNKSVLVHYSRGADPKTIEDVIVSPGDTIQVKKAGIVYVLGAVSRPGGYVMHEEGTLSLLQAISLANGTTLPASVKTVYVLRQNADGTTADIALAYREITRGKGPDFPLHAKDVVYVPTNKIKSIFSYSQGILTAATSASIYAAAVY